MTRRSLVGRVVALERGGPGMWKFTLETGRTVTVSVGVVLKVLSGGLKAAHGDMEGGPPPDLDSETVEGLHLLAQVDVTAEESLLGRAAIVAAKAWRDGVEGAGDGSASDA